MHTRFHHHIVADARWHGMGHHLVGVDGVDAQRIRDPAIVHGVQEVFDHLAGALIIERHGYIGLRGFAIHGHQADLRGGAVEGLCHHHLEHMFEEFRCARIEVVAHALKRVLLGVVQPDTDHEWLQGDALGLQGTAHGAGVFIARFDPIGDEDDHVAHLARIL